MVKNDLTVELAVISVILLNLFNIFCVSGTVLGTSIVSSSKSLLR